jgi:hypothetical protein
MIWPEPTILICLSGDVIGLRWPILRRTLNEQFARAMMERKSDGRKSRSPWPVTINAN